MMATQKANTYMYRPLQRSRNEIRVIKLLPLDGNEKLRLVPACHIFHAALDEHPKFVALSYVWGTGTKTRAIRVDNITVLVTENLYDAMIALRRPKEDLVVWIDYLCINQSDNEEKSWQVGLMADIYQKACKVVAWFGPAQSDENSIMKYLNSLGEKAEACKMHHGPETAQKVWQKLVSQPRELRDYSRPLHSLFYSISGWHDQDNLLPMAGIEQFFTLSWWGRIWVLQEITLPENAEFLRGNERITRRRCSAAFNAYCAQWLVLMASFIKQPQLLNPYQLRIIRKAFPHRPNIMLSSWDIYRSSRFTLSALLRATCVGTINPERHWPQHLESTESRDKIFALLGLAIDRKELENAGLLPDYSKSCKELYTTAMVLLLQQGHMSLLSFCQTPRTQLGLPSWVPDWSQPVTGMLQDVKNDHIVIYPKFSASGVQSDSKVTAIKREGVIECISVECYIFDEIYEVGSFSNRASSHEVPPEETVSWPVKWLVEIIRMSYQREKFYVDFSARLHAAARTSIGGVEHDQDGNLVRVGDDRFLDAALLLENGIKHIKGNNNIKRGLRQLLSNTTFKTKVKSRVSHSRLGGEIIGKSLGRLPFITKKGHLVLGPEYVNKGDVVAVIKGTQVPFILRRESDGRYQLIGEVYVDGIMDGEAMENSEWSEAILV